MYVSTVPVKPLCPCWKETITGPVVQSPVAGTQDCPTGQLTAEPLQIPPAHTSPVVQRLPSLQALALFACAQPLAGTHESVVHTFESSQFVAPPGWQLPPLQTSPVVQALPSLHAAVLFTCVQPLAGTQESVVQTFESSQFSDVPAWHTLLTHVSVPLQTLLSLQSAFVVQPPMVADTVGIRMKSELLSDWLCA